MAGPTGNSTFWTQQGRQLNRMHKDCEGSDQTKSQHREVALHEVTLVAQELLALAATGGGRGPGGMSTL